MKKKIILATLTIIVAFLIIKEILGLFVGDYSTSTIPGWHASIYSSDWMQSCIAILILILCFLVLGLIKIIIKQRNKNTK